MMDAAIVDIFRRHARPLEPIATGATERLDPLRRPQAVLLDIYGTLLISGCGDIGVASEGRGDAAAAALAVLGEFGSVDGTLVVETLHEAIASEHARARSRGVEHPEVAIDAVWDRVLNELMAAGRLPASAASIDRRRLAAEYEARINPVWPMPGARTCLERLGRAGITVGIVSNAQFFTPALFPALLGRTLEEFGVAPERQIYSYRYGRAKPDRFLFELAQKELTDQGIPAEQTIYVGNDMRNDVWPAKAVGMRGVLFAGDRRSLRLRETDPDVGSCRADAVVTDWHRFIESILSSG